jgi:hypothetical protein
MKNILFLCLIACSCFNGWAQNTVNDYKYVVVPLQYDFLKGQNVYRLNTLTKVLFKQHGFDVYFEKSELPTDLFEDRCLAMYADVHEVKGGFRKTRLEVTLKDCYGELIMTSTVGESGQNNHEKRHQIALRESFNSIKKLNYKYQPRSNTSSENRSIIKDKVVNDAEKVDGDKEVVNIEKTEVKATSVQKEKIETFDEEVEKEKSPLKKISNVLYSTPINKGYQIRDEGNKDVMVLFSTEAKNVFIVKGKSAIVFKENNKWMYSENDGIAIVVKELNIRF